MSGRILFRDGEGPAPLPSAVGRRGALPKKYNLVAEDGGKFLVLGAFFC